MLLSFVTKADGTVCQHATISSRLNTLLYVSISTEGLFRGKESSTNVHEKEKKVKNIRACSLSDYSGIKKKKKERKKEPLR